MHIKMFSSHNFGNDFFHCHYSCPCQTFYDTVLQCVPAFCEQNPVWIKVYQEIYFFKILVIRIAVTIVRDWYILPAERCSSYCNKYSMGFGANGKCSDNGPLDPRFVLPVDHWHGLTLISAWMDNYIHYKVWDKITCPLPNFNTPLKFGNG